MGKSEAPFGWILSGSHWALEADGQMAIIL